MKKTILSLFALLSSLAVAQAPSPNAYFSATPTNTVAKVCGVVAGLNVYCPSLLTDDGTHLLYNGNPVIGSGGPPTGTAGGALGGTYPSPTVVGVITPSVIYTNASYSLGTVTTAVTINPANGNRQNMTLTAGDTAAMTFTQPSTGTATVTVKVTQSSSASYNGAISGCKWTGGVVPTITQTTGAVDFITAYLDGTNAYCVASQNFQ